MSRPVAVDLFAGIGGFSLGVEQAGFDVAVAVEKDPVHAAAHAWNFPRTRVVAADLSSMSWADVVSAAGLTSLTPDLVFGGPPCQGVSSIGTKDVLDPRNDLMTRFAILAVESGAGYAVMENVSSLLLPRNRSILERVVAVLRDGGFDVRLPVRAHEAMDHGLPQSRRRLFLLAARRGREPPRYPLPILERTTPEEAIGDLPDADRFDDLILSDRMTLDWPTTTRYARRLRGIDRDPSDLSHPRSFDVRMLTASARTTHAADIVHRFSRIPQGGVDPIGRYQRLHPSLPSPTLRAGSANGVGNGTVPRPVHYDHPRCITVREGARLHGYPDWFGFNVAKRMGFQQIGNSVPPPMAKAVAEMVVVAMGASPSTPETPLASMPLDLLEVQDRREAGRMVADLLSPRA